MDTATRKGGQGEVHVVNIWVIQHMEMLLQSKLSYVYSSFVICFQFSAVGLTLNGVNHANNSIVTRTDIGTGGAALNCTTTYSPCCSSENPDTQWFLPDGSQVVNNGGLPYYRNRDTGTVLLHRNPQGTTTGIFRCDILDASGVLQRMFVGIYDSGTGES